MAAEITKFDTWLKDKLYRDLLFRIFVWICIVFANAYYALGVDRLSLERYFKAASTSMERPLNSLGTISIILGVVALMLKDLEFVSKETWGQESTLGKWGGVVRRLAGDLTLWTAGAFFSFFALAGYAGFTSASNWRESAIFSLVWSLLSLVTLGVFTLNVFVRRKEPTFFAKQFKKPLHVIVCYAFFIIGLLLYMWLR